MDITWAYQQENAKLRRKNEELKRRFAALLVGTLEREEPYPGRRFTETQRKIMRKYGLDYQRVYRLACRYQSVEDALVQVLEESI